MGIPNGVLFFLSDTSSDGVLVYHHLDVNQHLVNVGVANIEELDCS